MCKKSRKKIESSKEFQDLSNTMELRRSTRNTRYFHSSPSVVFPKARNRSTSRNPEMKSTTLACVRFLAVSATIPNICDLAEWLTVPIHGIKRFGEEMRPLKLTTRVFGYTPAKNDFLFEKRLQNYLFGKQGQQLARNLAEAGGKPQLARNLSAIQRKGYTSDEELEELDSPLTSVLDESPTSPSVVSNGNGKHKGQTDKNGGNTRYALLREVWLS